MNRQMPTQCPHCKLWFIHRPDATATVANLPVEMVEGKCLHEWDIPVVVRAIKGGTYKAGEIVEVSELGI